MVTMPASRPWSRTSLLRQEAPQEAELGVSWETENLWHQFTGVWGAQSSIPRTTQPAGPGQKVYSELLGVYPWYVNNVKSWSMGVKVKKSQRARPLVLCFSELGLHSALGARAVLPLMDSLQVRTWRSSRDCLCTRYLSLNLLNRIYQQSTL